MPRMMKLIRNFSLVATVFFCVSAMAQKFELIGGEPVTSFQRPWVVKIHFKGKGHCTGSLIHPQWVITAGHCFIRASAPYTNFTLGGGGDGQYENLIRLPNIKTVYIHPQYKGKVTEHDLALLRLESPVKVSKGLAPIALKGLASISLKEGTQKASITSWGLTSSRGATPTELLSITLPVRRTAELKEDIPPYFIKYPGYLRPGILVMIKPGTTTCRGDSGAGWTMEIDGKNGLVGIHSAGDFCQSIAIGSEITQNLLWIRARMLFGSFKAL